MRRLDRQRLDAAEFPVVTEIPIRYDDLDSLNHVNNAAAAVLLQEARGQFGHSAGLHELMGRDLRTIVAALAIEFSDEMLFPGVVVIRTGVLDIGRTSLLVGQRGQQDARTTLYAETVLVMSDDDGPTPIPPPIRAAFESLRIR
jgi:acyl-CoA thioester hydrolase